MPQNCTPEKVNVLTLLAVCVLTSVLFFRGERTESDENQAQEARDFWVEGRKKPELVRQTPRHQGTQRQHLRQLPPLGVYWTPGHHSFPITHSIQQMTGKATLLTSFGRVERIWDEASKPEFQSLPPWTFIPPPPAHTHIHTLSAGLGEEAGDRRGHQLLLAPVCFLGS